jgi:hypothetical protein
MCAATRAVLCVGRYSNCPISGNSFGWIQFNKYPNTAAHTKEIHSVVLELSRDDKQQDRRTDVSVVMGTFLQQFLTIAQHNKTRNYRYTQFCSSSVF